MFIAPESRDKVMKAAADNSEEPLEMQVLTKDGTRITVESRGKSVTMGGRNMRIVAVRDITDRKRAEHEIWIAKEKAENATKLKDKFVALVSHDLKGPIGAIRGMAQISLEGGLSPDEVRGYARHFYESANGLLAMIDKLLDISRLQSGAIRPDKQVFKLKPLAMETMAKISHLSKAKGLRISDETDENALLYADRTLAGEILLNLLTNAIKFTNPGGAITILSPTTRSFAVKDSGVGIKPEILPDIFRHDVKTVGYGTAGELGTGLGLPFCQEIMAAHKGVLRVESGENGTVFFAEFPEAKPIVMLADDQEVHRLMMKEQIEKFSNVDFIEANSGREALERLETCRPVLLISDINMPDMNGFELLRELRKTRTKEELPVIISTALAGSSSPTLDKTLDNKTHAFDLGANDFIMKPIVPAEFTKLVKPFLSSVALPAPANV
jgi:signal transduction histidine kinase/CheY-like chemotaxis protein